MITDSHTTPSIRTTLKTVGTGLLVTGVVFGGVVIVFLRFPALQQWFAALMIAAVAVHSLLMLAIIWYFLRRSSISLSDIGFSRPGWRLLHLLWQVPAILAFVLAAQAIVFAVTGIDPGSDGSGVESLAASVTPPVAFLLVVSVVVIVPIWEEVLFRGMIQGAVRSRFGILAGVVISALIFAAAHGVLILLPYMITLGLGLALLREFHRNLWGPLVMHCVLNAIASSVILSSLI